MEALMRKAREFMKKNKGNSGNSSISNYEKVTGSKRTTTPNIKKLISASTTKKSTNTVVTFNYSVKTYVRHSNGESTKSSQIERSQITTIDYFGGSSTTV